MIVLPIWSCVNVALGIVFPCASFNITEYGALGLRLPATNICGVIIISQWPSNDTWKSPIQAIEPDSAGPTATLNSAGVTQPSLAKAFMIKTPSP